MPVETILLAVIVLLLILVVALLARAQRQPRIAGVQIGIDPHLDEQLMRVTETVVRSVDVSAVLEMIVQIEEFSDEDRARLASYPETVRAACWQHYITGLGRDLQQAQDELSEAHRGPDTTFIMNGGKNAVIKAAQRHVDELRAKLDTAIEESGLSADLRAV